MAWAHAHASDLVRLRLDTPKSIVKISGFALQFEVGGEVQSLRLLPDKDTISISVRGQRWLVEVAGRNGSPSESRTFQTPQLKIMGQMLRLGADEIPNEVVLYADGRNRIEPVALLPLEDYLKGVIPSEMPARWPLEALKAQAIASRSYALHVMRERAKERYHLDVSTHHQVFKLINYLSTKGATRDNIVRAIEETRGIVLTDVKGQILKSFYHADCGGATEEPQAVWGGATQKIGTVKDSRCALSPQWNAQFTIEKFDERLKKALKIPAHHVFVDLRLLDSTPSGRVARMAFIYSDKGLIPQTYTISTQNLREIFGYDLIRSTRFSVERTGDEIKFTGRGYGHGAGMCQVGARFMAMGGASFEQILKRYYAKAQLQTTRLAENSLNSERTVSN